MRRAGVLCVAALLLPAACASGKAAMAPTPTAQSNEKGAVTLAIGESASLDGGALSVKFVRVAEDSRCPKGEQCIRAGNAKVELEVRSDAGPAQAVVLNTTEGETQAEVGSRVLRLDGLAPVPVSGRTIASESYRATLSLR